MMQVRKCNKEPDLEERGGYPGSYVLMGGLMKRLYELVDAVEISTSEQVTSVPEIKELVLKYKASGENGDSVPDVRLGHLGDCKVNLPEENFDRQHQITVCWVPSTSH